MTELTYILILQMRPAQLLCLLTQANTLHLIVTHTCRTATPPVLQDSRATSPSGQPHHQSFRTATPPVLQDSHTTSPSEQPHHQSFRTAAPPVLQDSHTTSPSGQPHHQSFRTATPPVLQVSHTTSPSGQPRHQSFRTATPPVLQDSRATSPSGLPRLQDSHNTSPSGQPRLQDSHATSPSGQTHQQFSVQDNHCRLQVSLVTILSAISVQFCLLLFSLATLLLTPWSSAVDSAALGWTTELPHEIDNRYQQSLCVKTVT